ncbi:MAG: hypothetical protein PHE27_03770 [Alphaproteobacteria bacterium]|nr:hypothetical protein [Alphaproteobacteria bacterium]
MHDLLNELSAARAGAEAFPDIALTNAKQELDGLVGMDECKVLVVEAASRLLCDKARGEIPEEPEGSATAGNEAGCIVGVYTETLAMQKNENGVFTVAPPEEQENGFARRFPSSFKIANFDAPGLEKIFKNRIRARALLVGQEVTNAAMEQLLVAKETLGKNFGNDKAVDALVTAIQSARTARLGEDASQKSAAHVSIDDVPIFDAATKAFRPKADYKPYRDVKKPGARGDACDYA